MKYLYFTVSSIIIAYIVVIIFVYFYQRNLLYHPSENNYQNDTIQYNHQEIFIKVNDEIYFSATSIGSNPTFKDQSKSIETYLIDFHGDLYNKTIEIEYIESIREQKMFSDVTKLIETMKEDIFKIKNILKEKK